MVAHFALALSNRTQNPLCVKQSQMLHWVGGWGVGGVRWSSLLCSHKKHSALFQLPTSQSQRKKKFYLQKKMYWWRGCRTNCFEILLEMREKVDPILTSGILNAGVGPNCIIQYRSSAGENFNKFTWKKVYPVTPFNVTIAIEILQKRHHFKTAWANLQ